MAFVRAIVGIARKVDGETVERRNYMEHSDIGAALLGEGTGEGEEPVHVGEVGGEEDGAQRNVGIHGDYLC